MELSVCSWIFGDQPIKKVLQFIKQSGYDMVELQAYVALNQSNEIKKISKNLNLTIGGLTGHTTWSNEPIDLANNDATNRSKAVHHFKEQIKVCRELDGDYVVVCPSAVGKTHLLGTGNEDWKWAIESVSHLCLTAEAENVDLIIEPINRYESSIVNTAEDAYRFASELNHQNVKMLVDTFHMNIEETNMLEAIEAVRDKLAVVHLADNNRKGVGMGTIDFDLILKKLKEINFQGPLVLECMAPGPNPFEANKSSMDELYKSCEHTVTEVNKVLKK